MSVCCNISSLLPLSFKLPACPLPAYLPVISDYLYPSASAFSPTQFISPRLLPTRTGFILLSRSSAELFHWSVQQKAKGYLVQSLSETLLHCSFIGGLGALNIPSTFAVCLCVCRYLLPFSGFNISERRSRDFIYLFLDWWRVWSAHSDHSASLCAVCAPVLPWSKCFMW